MKQAEPVPENRKSDLLPLVYYPIDPSYNVPAILKPPADSETLQMVYSDGAVRDVRKLGSLEFSLKGQPFKLTAYQEVGSPDVNHVFVPFTDLTSGVEDLSGRTLHRSSPDADDVLRARFQRRLQSELLFQSAVFLPGRPEGESPADRRDGRRKVKAKS